MTEIMLPVRLKWCELIASGKKTIEVRKFCPKCDVPFKVYIYCTKYKLALLRDDEDVEERYKYDVWNHAEFHESCGKKVCGGKVIGELVCRNMTCIQADIDIRRDKHLYNTAFFGGRTCLSDDELFDYIYSAPNKTGWGWWISDLKIYDEPKQLSEFYVEDAEAIKNCKHRFRYYGPPESVVQRRSLVKNGYGCMKDFKFNRCEKCLKKPLVRPPQNFCYVERIRENDL